MEKGKLYGVGIGPGDKELITLKAVNILKNADVIALPDSLSGKNRAYEIVKEYIQGAWLYAHKSGRNKPDHTRPNQRF